MKVQFYGDNQFALTTKDLSVAFNPTKGLSGTPDFVALTSPEATTDIETKKLLNLPGEYEISGILAQGFFTHNQSNVAYKVLIDSISTAYFSGLTDVPSTNFFEKLGENVDLALVVVNETFDAKKAKELVEKIDPRMVILAGDQTQIPKLVELMGAKTAEENPMEVKKSALSDDKTDVFVINA